MADSGDSVSINKDSPNNHHVATNLELPPNHSVASDIVEHDSVTSDTVAHHDLPHPTAVDTPDIAGTTSEVINNTLSSAKGTPANDSQSTGLENNLSSNTDVVANLAIKTNDEANDNLATKTDIAVISSLTANSDVATSDSLVSNTVEATQENSLRTTSAIACEIGTDDAANNLADVANCIPMEASGPEKVGDHTASSDLEGSCEPTSSETEQWVTSEEGSMEPESRARFRRSRPIDDDDSSESYDFQLSSDDDSRSKRSRSSAPEDLALDKKYLDKVPLDWWRPTRQLYQRELGYGRFARSGLTFPDKVMSSVSLVRRLMLETRLELHEGCVNALSFNDSGSLLVSGSDDLKIILWDWLRSKPYLAFDSGHRSNVFQCKFMPYSGDCHIVSCARDGTVRLAQLSTVGECRGTKRLAQHRGGANKLSVVADSPNLLYSSGEDAVIFEIDLRQEKPNKLCVVKEKNKKIPLYSVSAHPLETEQFCVGGRDVFVRIYDKRMIQPDGKCVKKFAPGSLIDRETKANVTCAVYNYNGSEILATYNDEDIFLFDGSHSDGAEAIAKYTGHRNNATVKGVNFYGPSSEFIVSGSDCSHVFFWDKKTSNIVNFFHADDNGVINVLEPHPCFPILATSGLDHDVKIWSPMASEPSDLRRIAKVCSKNSQDREADQRMSEPDAMDGHMLWLLMQQLRRSARRQARQEGDPSDEVEDSSSSSDDSEESDTGPSQCIQT